MNKQQADIPIPAADTRTSPETDSPHEVDYPAHLATPAHFVKKVLVHDIHKAVAEEFGLTFEELLSRTRARRFSRPRHVAIYLARQWTERSFPFIGFNTGRRDHSSVMNSCSVIKEELRGSEISELISAIERIKVRVEKMLEMRPCTVTQPVFLAPSASNT